MKPRLSLKKRIALSYILLTITVAGAFSLVTYISVEVIKHQVIDARLAQMADVLVEAWQTGQIPDAPPDVTFLIDVDIPVELRGLPTGLHELEFNDRMAHALLVDHDGSRYAVVQNIDEFEHTEQIILLSLGAGFVVSVLLATGLGMLSARRVLAPVSALAEAVSHNVKTSALPSRSAQDEIGVLARAFAKRADELQRFLLREQLFTGDVSHELRTPLTVILGAADVLEAQLEGHPVQLAAVERIRRVADEAAQGVGALLLLSRDPESLDAPRTELNAIVESEMERCRPLLAGKTVRCELNWSEPVAAEVRPELADIVIGNLLRNACRHTETGVVRVELTPGRLVVEDTGPGMPERVRERLFDRFVHGDDPPSHEGAGLGLSIVKRVADHIGWDVQLETPQTGGARFVLSFPVV